MNRTNTNKLSYVYSVLIHVIAIILLALINLNNNDVSDEYLTIGFGAPGNPGVAGQVNPEDNQKEELQETIKPEDQKVEVPKVQNEDENNVLTESKNKEDKKASPQKQNKNTTVEDNGQGMGDSGNELGAYGIDFDWGGRGVRKIQNWNLPQYPEGVSKEIDLRLKFTILPDGTVGKIIPLIKADTRLEMAAINSLRKWRFEPIPSGKVMAEQTVTITFPFRLR